MFSQGSKYLKAMGLALPTAKSGKETLYADVDTDVISSISHTGGDIRPIDRFETAHQRIVTKSMSNDSPMEPSNRVEYGRCSSNNTGDMAI